MFEAIMESKINQWQEDKKKPDYVPPKPLNHTFGKPLEQDLIDDFESYIVKASKEEKIEKKNEYLEKAKNLEIQLLISFENQGLHLIAQNMQKRLYKFRRENL